ncbi:MAG: hypothetical protein WCB92_13365, partial [Mycobacterium sp.]
MTIRPVANPPRRDTFAVTPVVEYEPPTRNVPQCRQSSHVALRPGIPRPPRRQPGGHGARQPARPADMSASMRHAAVFA